MINILNTLFLTIVISFESDRLPSSDDGERALRHAGRAVLEIAREEYKFDDKLKKFEKRYLPEKLKKYGGWTILVIRITSERQIRYEWTF